MVESERERKALTADFSILQISEKSRSRRPGLLQWTIGDGTCPMKNKPRRYSDVAIGMPVHDPKGRQKHNIRS